MGPSERTVTVNGAPCRVWEMGRGEPLGFLAGLGGVAHWSPFLDALAAERRVVVPSLPGFPGGAGLEQLDDMFDWVAATLDLLDGAGLAGADLVGASVGGMLAAEVAALSHATVKRLVLVAPYGLFDADEPTTDVFAVKQDELPSLLSAHPERLLERALPPPGADPAEWPIVLARASTAAARLLWPLGERGLVKRLHRVKGPTLLLWGEQDRVIPPSYAQRFAARITGTVKTCTIPDAGHLVDLDAPAALARAILGFLG